MRGPRLAGVAVDDHRNRVASVVDEQLLSAQIGLAHAQGELRFPLTINLTEAAVAITLGVLFDILVPQDLQGHVLAFELLVDQPPVRLMAPSTARLGARFLEHQAFKLGLADLRGDRPAEPSRSAALQQLANRPTRDPRAAHDLPHRQSRLVLHPQNLAHLAHRRPRGWHVVPPSIEGTMLRRRGRKIRSVLASTPLKSGWAPINRNGWASICRNARAPIPRNGGRLQSGIRITLWSQLETYMFRSLATDRLVEASRRVWGEYIHMQRARGVRKK